LQGILQLVIDVVHRPFLERIGIDGLAEIDRHILADIHQLRRPVDEVGMVKVRSGVALGIELARSHVAGIGSAVEGDELILIGILLAIHRVVILVHAVALASQHVVHLPGLIERVLGIDRSPDRALVDLIKVGLPGSELGR